MFQHYETSVLSFQYVVVMNRENFTMATGFPILLLVAVVSLGYDMGAEYL